MSRTRTTDEREMRIGKGWPVERCERWELVTRRLAGMLCLPSVWRSEGVDVKWRRLGAFSARSIQLSTW